MRITDRYITKNDHKYFCKKCRDISWLIECKCGCRNVLCRSNINYRIINYLYSHYQKHKGIEHPDWKGGRYLRNNYWVLNLPDYFSADKNGRVPEHIYVFQEYHKCCVLKWAVVHHIDPVRKGYCNNMPWNLVIMMRNEHIRFHNKTTRVYIKKDMSDRRCSNPECKNPTKTLKRSNGSYHWLTDKKGKWLCYNCYMKRYKRLKSLKILH